MIERVSLFNTKRDLLLFLLTCTFILFYSLLIEYQNFKQLTRFDSQILEVSILKQYTKTSQSSKKNSKTYQVLKLKSKDGLTFYTSAKKSLENIKGKRVELEVWAGKVSFYEYLTSFYAHSKVKHIYKTTTLKQELNLHISSVHVNKDIANIYQALYTATPLSKELQTTFSNLGVSHLLVI